MDEITELFGEPCSDFEPECPTCEFWLMWDLNAVTLVSDEIRDLREWMRDNEEPINMPTFNQFIDARVEGMLRDAGIPAPAYQTYEIPMPDIDASDWKGWIVPRSFEQEEGPSAFPPEVKLALSKLIHKGGKP